MAKKIKLSGKITVEVLVNSFSALQYLTQQPLRPIIAFRLSKILNSVQKYLDAYNVARKPIFEKFAKEDQPKLNPAGMPMFDGEGQPILDRRVPQDDIEKFKEKLRPVLDEIVNVKIEDIRIKDLGNVQVSAEMLKQLDWLIDE